MAAIASVAMAHSSIDPDAISALLDTPDHRGRQALLPDAVAQAGRLATQARTAVRIRAKATDPLVVRLVAQMQTTAEVHEDFTLRWTGVVVDDLTWPALAADLMALVANWAELITVVMPADPGMVIAEQQDIRPG